MDEQISTSDSLSKKVAALKADMAKGKTITIENVCPLCGMLSINDTRLESLTEQEIDRVKDYINRYEITTRREHADLRTCIRALRDLIENHEHGRARY